MKILKTLVTALLLLTAASASAQNYRLGYCDNTRTLSDKMEQGSSTDTYDAAIYLTPQMLEKVAGGQFTGVNVGVATVFGNKSITAWIRSELNGENLAEAETETVKKGWNAVMFSDPIDIEEGKGYYIGYTMTNNSSLSTVLLPVQQTGASGLEGSCWYSRGDGQWIDRHELGDLFLEALLVSENLPKFDLSLKSAAFQEEYGSEGSTVHLDLNVLNSGMTTVTSFETLLTCPDQNVSIARTVECEIPYGEKGEFTQNYVLSGLTPDVSHNFTLTITKVNGNDDQVPSDNSVNLAPFPFVAQLYPRTVLVEEFTTENCSYCPAAGTALHSAVSSFNEDLQKRIAAVCHHAGYGTDGYTFPCDEEFLWFYNQGGRVYAPGFMMDRAQSYEGSTTPVFQNPNSDGLINRLKTRLNTPSFLTVNIGAVHDAAIRSVKVTVSGKATKRPKTPSVFVYLVEDNVKPSKPQAGAATSWRHSHVIRAYNNEIWGEDPVWNDADGTYTYTCTLTYPAAAKADDMEIVALMANFDATNPINNEVENAAKLKLSESSDPGTTGAEAVMADDVYVADGMVMVGAEPAAEVYSMAGMRVLNQDLAPAVYVVKANGKSYKVVVR